MKILHLCLSSFYIDNYSYQENLLPKYHKKMGFDVMIVASKETFDKNGNLVIGSMHNNYVLDNDIPIKRLDYMKIPFKRKLRKYKGLYSALVEYEPDIIFIHGGQFLDLVLVDKYIHRFKPYRVFLDNHADYSNSANSLISKFILHKVIYRYVIKKIEANVDMFWGVLPARVDFLKDVYGISAEKTKLLIMGADDEKVNSTNLMSRQSLKQKYNSENRFLVVTGGKIDYAKIQTLTLMKIISENYTKYIKLIIFGTVNESIKNDFQTLLNKSENIEFLGWINEEKSYEVLYAADLVVFPGRHSVYWEQTVALKRPLLVKKWIGTDHIDIGGNCEFLLTDDHEELNKKIEKLLFDKEFYRSMEKSAEGIQSDNFLYSKIAKRSLLM